MGFLDDSNFHRSYWVYGKSFAGGHGGYFQAGKYAPAGRVLVHDDKNVYSYGREAQYYKWTTTMEYTLFSTPKDAAGGGLHRGGCATTAHRQQRRASAPMVNRSPCSRPALSKKAKGKAAKGKGKGKGPRSTRSARQSAPRPGSVRLPRRHRCSIRRETGLTLEPLGAARSGQRHRSCTSAVRSSVLRSSFATRSRSFHIRSASQQAQQHRRARKPLATAGRHLAATLTEDKTMRLYINGLQVAEGKASGLLDKMPARPVPISATATVSLDRQSRAVTAACSTSSPLSQRASAPPKSSSAFNAPELKPKDDAMLICNFDNGDSRDGSGNSLHGIGCRH
jgi:hypothetical protein